MNINKILVMFILLIMTLTTVTYAKENTLNKLPKGFQRLSDVELLNGTDLIPEEIKNTTLIPEGFYIPLEKKSNATKMLQVNRRHNNQKIKNPKNLLGTSSTDGNVIENNGIGYSSLSSGCSDIGSDLNLTFDNAKLIWNSTEDGYVTAEITKDLDGDNLNDTLITTSRYDSCTGLYYYTIGARKGKDGILLWKESFSGKKLWIYSNIIDDVDGDHLSDIMINIQEYDPISDKYYTQLKIKNGKSGTELWKESAVEGFIDQLSAGDVNGDGKNDILEYIQYYNPYIGILKVKKGIDGVNLWQESTNEGYISANSVEDLNGDKLNDLLVYIASPNSDIYEVKKGIDGTLLWQDNGGGIAVGDLNGDKLNDILVGNNGTLKAKKGIDGTILWQDSNISGDVYIDYLGDMNGDGLNDILLHIYDSLYIQTLKAKRGTDGYNLWEENTTNGNIGSRYIGDLNGDGLNEILVKIYDYNSNKYTLKAKKGIDGYNLWEENVTNGFMSYDSAGDLNGDGLDDILVGINDYNTGTYTLKAKKGKDGSILWQDINFNGGIYGSNVGDINGDKLNDVLERIYDGNSNTFTLMAKKGKDGSILWQDKISDGTITGSSVGDLNGDKLNDILVTIYDDISGRVTLIAKKGIDGSNLWSTMPISYRYTLGDLNGDNINEVLFYTGNKIYLVTTPISSSISHITVVSPNGGEIWQAGSTKTVKWSYKGNPGSYVKIDLLKNGALIKTIASSVSKGSSGNGTYSWSIGTSSTPGTDYKIRVTSTSNSADTDMSDNNFTITGPIIVTSPNGGENWRHGTSHTITWSKAGSPGSYVKIELLRSGSAVKTITSSTSNDGSYSWSISSTQTVASDYQIRITSTSNSAYKDTSDNYFTIST